MREKENGERQREKIETTEGGRVKEREKIRDRGREKENEKEEKIIFTIKKWQK